MQWNPDTTLRQALWIGGAQWAGKSTVAGILAERHGLTCYRHDYHDLRRHRDRSTERDQEAAWVRTTPRRMAEESLRRFHRCFEWVQDDLRALMSPRPILAEGCGLRPELIAPVTGSLRRMVVMVPTEEFRRHQLDRLPRASFRHPVSDPRLAQRNRLERNRLLAEDAIRHARRLGVRVIEVDGTRDAAATAELVADHWADFLA